MIWNLDFMSKSTDDAKEFFKPLDGKYDKLNAHLAVYAGVGGDDAKDWANMLFRMYQKYAERRGWRVRVTSDNEIDVHGEYAYGFLKREEGVHRLVRISPFSARKLRHTSFALIEVVPELPELEERQIVIPPQDLHIELSRAGGPGGQNVNRRETAVRVVHIPTGIAVRTTEERSQLQNKEKAMKLLKAKLFKLLEDSQAKELSALRTRVKPEWGSQIRSYVLHPYKLVKDHRTKIESSRPDAVLDGELDKFIEGELQ